MRVSFFNNYRDNKPKDIDLKTFLTMDSFKDNVLRIRNCNSKKEKDILKADLPAITPSGRFKERRSINNLVSHSGFMQIDIDEKDNSLSAKEIKKLLKDIEQVYYCAYSVSGKGVWGLIRIANTAQHKQHFRALQQDFKEFDIIIDKACSDVTRLRGYTYDKDYYLNELALTYERILKPQRKIITRPQKRIKYDNNDYFKYTLQQIDKKSLDITGDYEQWFGIVCAFANEFGETGRQFAHFVSQNSTKYDYKKCDDLFDRALKNNRNGYSLGTYYHHFNQFKNI